jgi:hypothetical protein
MVQEQITAKDQNSPEHIIIVKKRPGLRTRHFTTRAERRLFNLITMFQGKPRSSQQPCHPEPGVSCIIGRTFEEATMGTSNSVKWETWHA